MAHKTLIDGTAYELKGGMTLVGGTAHEIAGGKTLVNGTAYDVSFRGTKPIPVNIEGDTYDPDVGRFDDGVWIHGVEYTSAPGWGASTIYVYEGDEIYTRGNLFIHGQITYETDTFIVPGGITRIDIELVYGERGSEVWIYTS